jgi:hypothetical protein
MVDADVAQEPRHATPDARLACWSATVSASAFGAFVLLPFAAGPQWQPPGPEVVWALGAEAAVFLGPVAAGLAGWSSLATLWVRGEALTTGVRHAHLVTLLVVAAYAVGLVAAWSGGVFDGFGD